jgi:hypothetical protein
MAPNGQARRFTHSPEGQSGGYWIQFCPEIHSNDGLAYTGGREGHSDNGMIGAKWDVFTFQEANPRPLSK